MPLCTFTCSTGGNGSTKQILECKETGNDILYGCGVRLKLCVDPISERYVVHVC